MPFFRSVFFQVASTSLMKGLSLFILVAVILSDVILVFIALIHRAFSSLGVCIIDELSNEAFPDVNL